MFCTDFLGISPAAVGTILLVSNLIDAVTDLLAAYIIDNTKSKLGKGRPYELGIIGVTVCTTLMFFTPNSWSMGLKIGWVFSMYTFVFGVFNTFRAGSIQPYLIRAFDNNRVLIGKVASYGGLVTTVGSMVVALTFPKLMAVLATSAEGWRPLVLIYLVPLTLIGTLRFIFVKENTAIDAGTLHEKVKIADIFKMMAKNKYAWFYFGILFLFNCVTSLGALSYYFKYVVGDTSMTGILSVFGTVLLPVMLLFPKLLKKYSAAQIVGLGAIISICGYFLNFLAGGSLPMLIVAGILTSFASLPISYLQGIMVMDLCNYNEYLDLPRMDASTSAIFGNLSMQLGQGVGGALMGFAMTAAGYIAAEGDTLVTQPDSAIFMIRCMYSLIPLVMMVALLVFAMLLGGLKKKMPEIEKKLSERSIHN